MISGSRIERIGGALALAALLACAPAHAERYRVDLIVFADKSGTGGESPGPVVTPVLEPSLETYETAPLRAAGIEILPDEQFGLTDAWARMRNSRYHQPLLRLAWLQKDPPSERGPRLHLRWGAPLRSLTPANNATVYPVDGTVALLAGRYLHLDADLVYTLSDGAALRSHRLREKRRLRRDEVHHLDSPRLGLLVRAQRAPESGAGATPALAKPPVKKPTTTPTR